MTENYHNFDNCMGKRKLDHTVGNEASGPVGAWGSGGRSSVRSIADGELHQNKGLRDLIKGCQVG